MRPRLSIRSAAVAAALAGLVTMAAAVPANASPLPVNYDFLAGATSTAFAPQTPPPGANIASCRLTEQHPYPVILVHGTLANMNDNWQAASPLLANNGYCVYAFNYGGSSPSSILQATGPIETSAQQLSDFVNQVLATTGASKVDLVGHSQGGMMPRYYLSFLGGGSKVDRFVALAPSNHGSTLDGLTTLLQQVGLFAPVSGFLLTNCDACLEQTAGSAFLANLNAQPNSPGVRYTVIETTGDEVVTPYTSAYLPAAPNVTNITVQDQCTVDYSDHLEIAADPVALTDMLNALDPAAHLPIPCTQPILPLTGPVLPS